MQDMPLLEDTDTATADSAYETDAGEEVPVLEQGLGDTSLQVEGWLTARWDKERPQGPERRKLRAEDSFNADNLWDEDIDAIWDAHLTCCSILFCFAWFG